jgi:hypothetical protein
MTGYDLSRNWFDFCFENPEKIKPNHTAMYFFAIEHCNRLGWKKKFGFPATMVMEAIGIKSYNTYINTLKNLVEWGFIQMIERSKNQYSSNIIALSNFNKALDKALDKALVKHGSKQRESTVQSIDSINKQRTINKEQLNKRSLNFKEEILTYKLKFNIDILKAFYEYWSEPNKSKTKMKYELQKTWDLNRRLTRWDSNNFSSGKKEIQENNPKYKLL